MTDTPGSSENPSDPLTTPQGRVVEADDPAAKRQAERLDRLAAGRSVVPENGRGRPGVAGAQVCL